MICDQGQIERLSVNLKLFLGQSKALSLPWPKVDCEAGHHLWKELGVPLLASQLSFLHLLERGQIAQDDGADLGDDDVAAGARLLRLGDVHS